MTRSLLFLILATFVLSSTSDKLLAHANNKVSCSCTLKTPAANSHKVVTKSAECKAGISKAKCCAKAAKAWPSVQNCKYSAAAAGPTPELGGLINSGAGQPSNKCDPACNTAAGSQCVEMSGGAVTTPRCTCNSIDDCPCGKNALHCPNNCGPYLHYSRGVYSGNVCNVV